MATEASLGVTDHIEAALVECVPEDPPAQVLSVDASAAPDDVSPVQHAMEATLAQTGADPPPAVTRG